jgi:uncharacterized membrane protein YgcG
MEKLGFEFPVDVSQQWDGFNEPGMQHFTGSPFRSLGREGTQNTCDAAKKGAPARITIRRINVATSSIPGIDDLRKAIKHCAAGSEAEGDKAKRFFDSASALVAKPKISVLQFSDHNTMGVVGPCVNGKPYFALMKATGQSKKESGTAGGSFGIGKFAPFAISALRTIFITTVWVDDQGALQHYVQGKSILMSHKRGSTTHRGTGFWGERKNCLPLIGQKNKLPEWLCRESEALDATGTTVNILGFAPQRGWEKILTGSIAESFFASISRGNLEIEVEGEAPLNKGTIKSLFDDDSVREALADQKDEPDAFVNSGQFLRCITSDESKVEETENAGLGRCRLHILVGENLPKKVAVLRNGMLITSELERLRRFGEFKEFVAVLECLSDKGNALLRDMEPPTHDDFEPARLLTSDQQRVARIALRELAHWVREMLKRHAQDPIAEVTELDELAEFFGDDEADGSSGPRDGDENPRGAIKIRARPLPPKKPSGPGQHGVGANGQIGVEDSGDDGDGEGNGDGGSSDEGGGGGGRSTSGAGGEMSESPSLSLQVRNVRAVVLAPTKRRVIFTPTQAGEIRVELEDSGADTNRNLKVTASSAGSVIDGSVRLTCGTARVTLDVTLERPFEGTVRVKAHAV